MPSLAPGRKVHRRDGELHPRLQGRTSDRDRIGDFASKLPPEKRRGGWVSLVSPTDHQTYHNFHIQSTALDLLLVRSRNRFVPVFRLWNHFRLRDSRTGVGGHCKQIDMSVGENIESFVNPGRRGIMNARCLCLKNHSFAVMVYRTRF